MFFPPAARYFQLLFTSVTRSSAVGTSCQRVTPVSRCHESFDTLTRFLHFDWCFFPVAEPDEEAAVPDISLIVIQANADGCHRPE